MRRGRKNGDRGVWYGARVCILAHEGGPWVMGKVHCFSAFRLHLEHVQGRGAGSGSMPYVESEALTHAGTDGQLRRFPVPEPGRAFRGQLWPNRGTGFESRRFGSSPHPSPGAHKRGSVEPLAPLHCLFFAASNLQALCSPLVSLPVSLLVCDCRDVLLLESLIRGDCQDYLPCCQRSATTVQPDGPVRIARCHEPRHNN